MEIVAEPGSIGEAADLFAETERIRRETMQHLELSAPVREKEREKKRVQPEIPANLIFGKPFRGEATPMRT